MKKASLIGVMVLLGAVACQRDVVTDNPTYNADTQEVTAQFVLSVSTAHGSDPATRMTSEDVQYKGNFRGMTDVHLITYSLGFNTSSPHRFLYKNGSLWDESVLATRDYDLGSVMTQDEIDANQTSKVLQISLPLGTNSVLVYGRAPKTTLGSDDQGKITGGGTFVNATPDNIYFELENRMTETGKKAFAQFADMMGRILTGLLTAGRCEETAGLLNTVNRDNRYTFWWPMDDYGKSLPLKNPSTNEYWPNGETRLNGATTYKFYIGSKTWKDYGVIYQYFLEHPDETSWTPVQGITVNRLLTMEEILGETYYRTTKLGQSGSGESLHTELRAASSKAILQLVKDLFGQMAKVAGGTVTSPEDQIAKLVADEVIDRAKKFFDGTPQDLAWESFSTIRANFIANVPMIDANNTSGNAGANTFDTRYPNVDETFFYSATKGYPGFPMNLGMPEGTATMQFSTVGPPLAPRTFDTVIFPTETPDYMMGGSATSTLSIFNYHYPAELVYWTNSCIKTNTSEVAAADYPHTWAGWDAASWGGGWINDGTVQSSTRAVAVTKEMNYGTALLLSTFRFGASTIYDNNQGIHPTEQPNSIDVTKGTPFKVTGLIIGGVDDKVGWDMLSYHNTFSQVIYDKFNTSKQINIPVYGAAKRDTSYTLVWDNYNATLGDQQSKVYVAVELVNQTGRDLWGELNIIRNGATFYLVGQLDPADVVALADLKADTNNLNLSRSNFNYPPYDENGNTLNIPRIFMQDCVTEAHFVFGKYSLSHAYVTMPDLRASNVSLGLSVDLTWSKGYKFENVVLGGAHAND